MNGGPGGSVYSPARDHAAVPAPVEVGEELATTQAQIYALVRSGELPAIKLGGWGQWRVERAKLEAYIEGLYAETAAFRARSPVAGRARGPLTERTRSVATS